MKRLLFGYPENALHEDVNGRTIEIPYALIFFRLINIVSFGTLADPGGRPGGPAPRPPDLEASVYNLRVKQSILETLFYIFLKIFGLASLSMNLILFSHSSSLTLLIISMFHILVCILTTLYGLNP